MRRTTSLQPGRHDQVPAMHSETTMRCSAASTFFTTRPRMATTPPARYLSTSLRASPLGEHFRPENLVNQNAGGGNSWAKAHTWAGTISSESPCGVAGFVANSVSHNGERPTVRLCAGLTLSRCVHTTPSLRATSAAARSTTGLLVMLLTYISRCLSTGSCFGLVS